jgi:hypothetical protein
MYGREHQEDAQFAVIGLVSDAYADNGHADAMAEYNLNIPEVVDDLFRHVSQFRHFTHF